MKRLLLGLVVLLAIVTPSAAGPRAVDDLMMDMQIAPLDPQAPPPLAVEALTGGRVTLADVKGHVVLVYFWATW